MPRLLLVSDSLSGGLGAAVRLEAEAAAAAGWETALASPEANSVNVSQAAVTHAHVPIPARSTVFGIAAAARMLRRYLRDYKPDVVHCHGLRSFAVTLLAGRRALITYHGGSMGDSTVLSRGRLRTVALRLIPRVAVAAISVTPGLPLGWTFAAHASPRLR